MKKNRLLTLSLLTVSSFMAQIDAMAPGKGYFEESDLPFARNLAERANRAMGRRLATTPAEEAAVTTPSMSAAPATSALPTAAPRATVVVATPRLAVIAKPDLASVKNKLGQARAHFIDLRQTLVAVRKAAADARAAGDTNLADELDAEIKGLEEQIQDALPPRIRLMRGGADL